METLSLDDASESLMIELQMQELENLVNSSKGKHIEGEQPDFDLALAIYKSELESYDVFFSDRRMCRSAARAVVADGDLIYRQHQTEDQVARDHHMALNFDSDQETPSDDPADDPADHANFDSELINKLAALYVLPPDDELADQPESSSWASSRPRRTVPKTMTTCVSCRESFNFYEIARCPCSHEYCRTCLATLFSASMKDDSLYPPRCCRQTIPLEPNRPFLSAILVGQFLAKKTELDDTHRTYCHKRACSTYIPGGLVEDDVGSCPRCFAQTCVMCKGVAHKGDCPKDFSTQELLRIAAQNGWQRCYSCHRVVELEYGCNHMSECPPITSCLVLS